MPPLGYCLVVIPPNHVPSVCDEYMIVEFIAEAKGVGVVKRIVILLLALGAVLSLSACSSEWESGSTEQYEKVKYAIIKVNGLYLLYGSYRDASIVEGAFDLAMRGK